MKHIIHLKQGALLRNVLKENCFQSLIPRLTHSKRPQVAAQKVPELFAVEFQSHDICCTNMQWHIQHVIKNKLSVSNQ